VSAKRLKNAPLKGGGALPFGNSLEVGPVAVNLAEDQKASFRGWFSPSGYSANFAGDAPLERLLQIARAAGATAIHPALEGDTKFEWQASGIWGGFAPPQTTGTIHLQGIRAEFPGFNAPVAIASGEISLTPDTFKLEKLSATSGGIHWTGTFSRPRVCPGPAACPTQVDLHADELSTDKLNALLNPNIHKQPWYRILTGSPQQANLELRALAAQGTLHVDHLLAGDLDASAVTTKLQLADGHLHLTEVRGAVLGGHHVGDWQGDFTKDPPEYTITGALEGVSLPQLSKMTRANWITGSAHMTYALTLAGWSPADLQSSSRGTFTVDAEDGTLPHFGPAASAFKFAHLRTEFTTGKSLVVVAGGKLENVQGAYEISGVASFGHKLDLKFTRKDGHGLAVGGTLEEPHIVTIAPAALTAKK
jgi:hypothetical protein